MRNVIRDPRCPRCNYDLRGTTALWTDTCPLEGVCTECGLSFEWADLFDERRRVPRWCVEYAASPPAFLRRTAATLLMTFRPWRFWKSLKMSHQIRWTHLVGYLCIVCVTLYLMMCVAHGVMYRTYMVNLAPRFGTGFVPSGWETLYVMLQPRTTAFGRWISPQELFDRYWAPALQGLAAFLIVHALCPIGFVTLPVSRRAAKVRWAHVVRITIYGLLLPLPAILCFIGAMSVLFQTSLPRSLLPFILLFMAAVAAFAILPLEVVWWSVATGRHLKMPHAWGIGAAVVIMSVLTTMLGYVIFYIVRYWWEMS
ncbi:MAG: hypothetical protein ACYTGR_19350 [Planctomycetota bacterium]